MVSVVAVAMTLQLQGIHCRKQMNLPGGFFDVKKAVEGPLSLERRRDIFRQDPSQGRWTS